MRQKIIHTIKSVGLDERLFIIGRGAKKGSEIHYRPSTDNLRKGLKYSIQFSGSIVAVWEIGKRIDKGASIDLYFVQDIKWSEIDELQIRKMPIQNDTVSTEAAVMPFVALESYLRTLSECGKEQEDIFYRNRCEGEKYEIFTTRYERDPKLRQRAVEIHGTRCQACGFSFEEKFGKLGEGYVEVHHIKPISSGVQYPDPTTDMVCLCSNCHRMIHRERDRVLSLEEMKAMIRT